MTAYNIILCKDGPPLHKMMLHVVIGRDKFTTGLDDPAVLHGAEAVPGTDACRADGVGLLLGCYWLVECMLCSRHACVEHRAL